jgi:hypothetical protein
MYMRFKINAIKFTSPWLGVLGEITIIHGMK